VAAPRRSRAGVAAGALALAGLVVLAVYPIVAAGADAAIAAAPGGLAVVVLALAFAFRAPSVVPWALVPLLVEYGTFLVVEGDDPAAPAVAAGLVLVAELAYWALEPRHVGRGRALALRRAGTLAVLAAGAAAVAAFLLGVSEVPLEGGIALEAVGVAAVVAAAAVVVWLGRTPTSR
jgi:hypothetical protein